MNLIAQALGVLDWITRAANIVGTILIVMLVLVISTDVVGREVFGAPLSGVPEILSLSIVAIVFLQVPAALRSGRLTRSDGVLLMLEDNHPKVLATLETVVRNFGYFGSCNDCLCTLADSGSLDRKSRFRWLGWQYYVSDLAGEADDFVWLGAARIAISGANPAPVLRERCIMTAFAIGMLSIGAMALLVLAGLYVPIALILCSFVGVWAIKGSSLLAAKMLGLAANDAISSYFFGVVPVFVLMGFIVSESGMGRDAFDVANAMFKRIKGRTWALAQLLPIQSLPRLRASPSPRLRYSQRSRCRSS